MNFRWIPIDEELPPDDRNVLLSIEGHGIVVIGNYRIDEEGGGAFYLEGSDRSLSSDFIIVNAWGYLPKPYEDY